MANGSLSLIKPAGLRSGDRIGIISPAGPVDEADLQPGLRLLESSGFRIRVASHVYSRKGYLAGEDQSRLDDLHAMFQDREIKAVFCARGGYGTLRLLDRISYDLIRTSPKILVGYSDITALLMAIHRKTGLVTYHGPTVREFASGDKKNLSSLLRLISSKQPVKLSLANGTAINPGRAKGVLFGGNLTLICHLVGTPFLPSFDGCILFLEEKNEPLYRVDRMLTHLRLAGHLKGLSALIAGDFDGCGDRAAINSLLMDMTMGMDIPIAAGLPIGHGSENSAVPLGLMADLDTDLMTLSIMQQCVMD